MRVVWLSSSSSDSQAAGLPQPATQSLTSVVLPKPAGAEMRITPGGQVSLRLEDQDTNVEIQVEDTGIGLLPEDLPYLFERFHRGRNASGYGGNGLGLAIARTIVKNHKGEIWAERAGKGMRFVVLLPLIKVLPSDG